LKLDSDSFLEEEVMDLTNKSAGPVDAFKHTKICEEEYFVMQSLRSFNFTPQKMQE